MRKFFKIIALLLVLVLMAGGAFYVLQIEKADDQRMADIYAEVESLAKQKDDLTRERDSLQSELNLQKRDYSTFEIIFPDIRDEVYTQAYPVMRDHGVVGVLGMSYAQLPDGAAKLTTEQINRLLSEGWGTCLVVDSYIDNFAYYYQNITAYLSQFRISAPTTVYFPDLKFYNESMTSDMIASGITTVIFDGTDGRTSTVTDVSGDLWTTYAMPWNYTGITADFQLLGRTDGGNQAYVLRFSEYWDKNRNYKQQESQEYLAFKSLLESWDKEKYIYSDDLLEGMETIDPSLYMYSNTSDADALHDLYLEQLTPEQQLLLSRVRSTNFENALEYHRTASEKSDEQRQQKEERLAELDREIAALTEQIAAVYETYDNSSEKIDLSSVSIGSFNLGSLLPGQQNEGGNS